MNLRIFKYLFFVCLPFLITPTVAGDEFIYDAGGKKDPFVPYTDRASSTGLRNNFTPPDVEIKLPITIELKGILWNGREFFAVINGEVLQAGGNLGPIKIKQIEENKVILEYGKREFSVLLKKEPEK